MKATVATVLIMVFAGCATTPVGYDADTTPTHNGEAWQTGPSGLQVTATEDEVYVGVDFLGIKNYEVRPWAKESWGLFKVVTYPVDYIGYMVQEHPFQTLGIGLLAWELTDSGVSDTLGSLFDGGSGDSSQSPRIAVDGNSGESFIITGDNNQININDTINTDTVP